MNERRRPWAFVTLGLLPIVLAGCVAHITETRLYGAARPATDARSEVIVERHTGLDGAVECRDVTVYGPMIREVVIRRSFADHAQDRNAALAMLLGGGIGLLAYGQDEVQCPQQGGGCSDPTNAALALLGLAAIPVGFLAYNAVAVQDSRALEPAEPEAKLGQWHACSVQILQH
ncbi:MAG: hypothetical protein ACLP1X_02920 [Polyangiaceae bacterium]|jgi:hypothetical protein